jgi:outer membrane lipoprotein SlyB
MAAAACGGKDQNRDLQNYSGLNSGSSAVMSPAEMGLDSESLAVLAGAKAPAPAPVTAATTSPSRTVQHSTRRHHTYSSASAPVRTRTIKHTKRDAAIGAAAGAAVGGLASHSVKGAVIGGVVGGVLGGVVGNNVDVKHKQY